MVTTSTLPPSPRPSRRLASIIWSSMCATSRYRIDSGRRSSALPKVGEVHATPKRPNPPKMHFYSGDHGGGARSPHDIALLEDTSSAGRRRPEVSMFGHRRVRSTTSPFVAASFQPARLPPKPERPLCSAQRQQRQMFVHGDSQLQPSTPTAR